jgi:hypothetical protein
MGVIIVSFHHQSSIIKHIMVMVFIIAGRKIQNPGRRSSKPKNSLVPITQCRRTGTYRTSGSKVSKFQLSKFLCSVLGDVDIYACRGMRFAYPRLHPHVYGDGDHDGWEQRQQ